MALKAEGAALDCFEVTLKCEEGEDEEEAMVVAVIPRPEPMLRVAQQEKTPPPRPNLLEAGGDGCEEPRQQVSWEQEFLVGNSPGGSGRALCMVCGAEIRSPSADTARMHILEQHPHTLDLSPSEKSNILEAWSEGVALLQDVRAEQPSSPTSDLGQDVEADPDSDPDPAKMPAEIVVLLDSEDNPSLPKRSRPRGLRPLEFPAAPTSEPGNKKPRGQRWKEPPGEEPVRKKRGRPMTKNLDLDPDPDPGDGEAQCGCGHGLWPRCSERKAKLVRGAVGSRSLDSGFSSDRPLRPTVPSCASFQTPHHPTPPRRLLRLPLRSGTSPTAASPLASSSSSSPTPSSGPQTARTHPKRGELLKGAFPSRKAPLQLPLRGFAGHWISRLSAYGWRSPRQSASCKTGPSTPRAPRVWEQVTPQTGLRFCRNPAPLSGGSQRQGVVYRFLLSWGGGEGRGRVPLWLITQSCPARPPDGESKTGCQGRLEDRKVGGAASTVTRGHWQTLPARHGAGP
ncbi:spindlin interactor and repressor of chromatin-binding protein isoform X1 [Prionailurus bengalensis]|uniref:spindlin interactor and repressor of chromatin-binding protein isoform X1 n=1 Tax=Prionailurus bengalensis TaxID=37029 RepID=UPI001CA8792D|nr:spindlin interactor and repressor of chromatin-binding protein isoform X1 [Prionailurus bengalensis]